MSSKRTASWLAWSMCALSLALTALSLLLLSFNRSYPDVPVYTYWVVDTLVAIGLSTVGAVIVPRCPPTALCRDIDPCFIYAAMDAC